MDKPDDKHNDKNQTAEEIGRDNVVAFIPRVKNSARETSQTHEGQENHKDRISRGEGNHGRVQPLPHEPSVPPTSSYSLHRMPSGAKHPPMFNIPAVTKILIMVMIGIQIMVQIAQSFYPVGLPFLAQALIFVPKLWSSGAAFHGAGMVSPLGSMFAHGGWFHLAVNVVSLAAFGSGAEKIYGARKYLILFFGSGLVGLVSYFAFYPFTGVGVLGASGAISGIFGAVLYNLYTAPQGGQKPGIGGKHVSGPRGLMHSPLLVICLIYVVISVISGMIGAPNGEPIAWIVHIGGFLAGIGFAAVKKS